MKLIEYTGQQVAAESLANLVRQQLQQSIRLRGMASLALAGGSTPKLFLQQLGQQKLDWSRVNITTTDERQVSLDHERSNARLINETLLSAGNARQSFMAMNQGWSLSELTEQFKKYFIPLDICVLGMGDDGHTASLFPGVDEDLLLPNSQALIAEVQPPGDLEARFTLTARALLMAPSMHILIHGENKKQVLDQAIKAGEVAQMPVRCILRQANARVMIHYAPNP